MNLVELDQALRKLRLSGMADVLETRLLQAQAEQMAPIDLVAALVTDELQRRQDRLLARRHKQARFRDPERSLDGFDFAFNKKINRALVFELATARFVAQREDALLLGPPGTGKSHLAQAIGRAAIQQGYRVIYREAHAFLEELAEATLAETRKDYLTELTPGAPAHHRRPRHAQAAPHRGRGPARADHAPLRAGLHGPHLEPTGRRLGEAARRHRRRHGAARSPAPSRARAEVRPSQLAHQGPDHLANTGRREVELNSRLGTPEMAGFAVSTNGRI